MQHNIVLTIEYDGRNYYGWQYQPHLPSIEGTLLDAIEKVCGKRVTLLVAGRTDAGVHAQGQVANFIVESDVHPSQWHKALNSHLPSDINIHTSAHRDGFNARSDSIGKRYRYRVYNGPSEAALLKPYAWHIIKPLDLDLMQQAASHLIGELDFNAYRSAHCDAEHARRHLYSIDIASTPRPPVGQVVDIVIYGNAFCRHMCRIIAGTLIDVGRKKRSVDSVLHALESKDRTQAGPTAPPQGLTLLEVHYPSL